MQNTRIKSCEKNSFFLIYRLGFTIIIIYAIFIFDEKLLIYIEKKDLQEKNLFL